jgi:hypothetical protein
LAVDFTKAYMENFETISKTEFTSNAQLKDYTEVQNGLTVCAGIAFIKSSYPFHYAVELAESLCRQAKKAAKKIDEALAPSCLMFHKVQDSFVEDFKEIAERELTPQLNLSFEYGPYYCGTRATEIYVNRCNNTIKQLTDAIEQLDGKEGSAIKSHLRQWLSLLFDNVEAANQKMKRLIAVNEKSNNKIIVENRKTDKFSSLKQLTKEEKDYWEKIMRDNIDKEAIRELKKQIVKIPYHDILSLTSILTQETKKGGTKQ